MVEVKSPDCLNSVRAQNRLGKPRCFGTAIFAFTNFGADYDFRASTKFGEFSFGKEKFGNIVILSGEYSVRRLQLITEIQLGNFFFGQDNFGALIKGPMFTDRQPYRTQKYSRSTNQGLMRSKLASAVLSYKGLTIEQKLVYHKIAVGKHYTGYNAFLREYLLSH